jgi:putative DNA primase/helicase
MHDVAKRESYALAEAIRYAKQLGWFVFPADVPNKKSYKSEKYSGAKWGMTKDEKQIRDDFAKWPNAGIGIPTGEVNGIFVVEADTKVGHGVDGIASLRMLQEKHGELPPTRVARSPSGSLHFYFKWPDELVIKNSASELAPGIDVRGQGGMVIAPPSERGDGKYEWVSEEEIAEAPRWLLDAIFENPRITVIEGLGEDRRPPPELAKIAYAMEIIPNDQEIMVWKLADKDTKELRELTGWEGWNTIMMALWSATGGSSDAYNMALKWCRKNRYKFNEADAHDSWHNRYLGCPPKDLTVGTLFAIASFFKPGWQQDFDRENEQVESENTELGNARRLVKRHGENIRFVHAWGSWIIWEDGHWRRDNSGGIMRLAKATVEAMLQGTFGINDQHRRNVMLKHALLSQKATQLRNMVALAESESEVVLSPDKIDANPLLLGVKNGVIDLRTGTFREARREDYVSKIAGCSYNEHARCPNWDAFLLKIFDHNEELIRYIQRVAGYMLTGLTVEEVLFVMWGLGANGKSTFRETIFALLGDYYRRRCQLADYQSQAGRSDPGPGPPVWKALGHGE